MRSYTQAATQLCTRIVNTVLWQLHLQLHTLTTSTFLATLASAHSVTVHLQTRAVCYLLDSPLHDIRRLLGLTQAATHYRYTVMLIFSCLAMYISSVNFLLYTQAT